jgi:quinol monooxygenase YgiN
MIVLIARYTLKNADDMPTVTKALNDMAERVRADEPGCTFYQASRSTEQDGLIVLYEQYTDDAAVAAHRDTPHYRQFIEGTIVPLLANRERELFELLVS